LQIPALRVPKALALLREKRLFQALVRDRTSGDDQISACELAGKILALMQIAQTEQICPMPVDALACDLAEAPWHLSSREQTILESALENLAGAKVSFGHVYYDTPANLLFENDQLSLVDSARCVPAGSAALGFFMLPEQMRYHLWRFSLRRPFDRRRAMIKRAIAVFHRSYLANLDKLYDEPALFAAALLRILEDCCSTARRARYPSDSTKESRPYH